MTCGKLFAMLLFEEMKGFSLQELASQQLLIDAIRVTITNQDFYKDNSIKTNICKFGPIAIIISLREVDISLLRRQSLICCMSLKEHSFYSCSRHGQNHIRIAMESKVYKIQNEKNTTIDHSMLAY